MHGGFLSISGKKLSTFEFLFSWQNRTLLLTGNQRTLLRSKCHYLQLFLYFSQQLLDFAQQLQKRSKIQMFSTPCRSVTSLGLSFLKSLRLFFNFEKRNSLPQISSLSSDPSSQSCSRSHCHLAGIHLPDEQAYSVSLQDTVVSVKKRGEIFTVVI